MSIMGHDEFNRHRRNVDIIHERRTNFASDRYDFHRLPVEGSFAYSGPTSRLADVIGGAALAVGFLTVAYMLGRWAVAAIFHV